MSLNGLSKAAQLEAELRDVDEDVYLHEYGMPLVEAIASTPRAQTSLFNSERCDSGFCFV